MHSHRPEYYRAGDSLEAILIINYSDYGFNLGNTIKYLLRAGIKSREYTTDLIKARQYLVFELWYPQAWPIEDWFNFEDWIMYRDYLSKNVIEALRSLWDISLAPDERCRAAIRYIDRELGD